jgi:hypothetical protein
MIRAYTKWAFLKREKLHQKNFDSMHVRNSFFASRKEIPFDDGAGTI